MRQGVGRGTIPGADAHIHSAAVRFFTEIFSPVPASEIDLDRAALRVHARFAITAHNNRPQVALADVVNTDEIEIRSAEFVEVKRNFHAVDVGRIQQALDVIAKAKNSGALLSVVAANAFENRGTVADDVRKDVNVRLVPLDKLSVMPNLFGFRDGH